MIFLTEMHFYGSSSVDELGRSTFLFNLASLSKGRLVVMFSKVLNKFSHIREVENRQSKSEFYRKFDGFHSFNQNNDTVYKENIPKYF